MSWHQFAGSTADDMQLVAHDCPCHGKSEPGLPPSRYALENARWMVEFYHQWDSFLPRVNWRDFTLLCIEGEWNHSWPLVEFRVVLFGLGLRVVRQLDVADDETSEPLRRRRPSDTRRGR